MFPEDSISIVDHTHAAIFVTNNSNNHVIKILCNYLSSIQLGPRLFTTARSGRIEDVTSYDSIVRSPAHSLFLYFDEENKL